jgi:hypothetical protein
VPATSLLSPRSDPARSLEAQFLFQDLACGPRGEYLVMGQQHPVEPGPFQQVLLLVVMSDEGDLLVLYLPLVPDRFLARQQPGR